MPLGKMPPGQKPSGRECLGQRPIGRELSAQEGSGPERPADGEAPLLAARAEFPSLARGVHLVSHSLGAMPAKARAYVTQFADEWENASVAAWGTQWLPAVRELGDVIARVLGVAKGSVCPLPNVSTAQAIVASNLAQAQLLHDVGVISIDSLLHGYRVQ